MSISNNYRELAEKIYSITETASCKDKKKDIISSIKSQFYAIEEQLENELKIHIKKYKISERVEIIEMLYIYKNYYYSREQIIDFVERFYTDIEGKNIFDKFLEFKKVTKLFEKEYKNILCCQAICSKEKDKEKALEEVKKKIDKNEVNIIKKINDCTLSDTLFSDLKKYYFRIDLENDKRYAEFTVFMNSMQLDMSDEYTRFLKRLQHGFYYENKTYEEKKIVYDEVCEILKKIEEAINQIEFMDSENRQDLMAIFYIRLKRNEIGKILKFEEKLLSFLEKQSKTYKLKNYKSETSIKSTKITELSKDIFLKDNNITKSQIRTLQLEHKNLVPVLKNKYGSKLTMLNENGKVKKVLLREIDLSKRSSKEKSKEQELDLKNLKLTKIINKMKQNSELTNEERIFIDTVVDRGIILENGKLNDSLMINRIDIKISEILLNIYYLNNILQISICIQNVFELLNAVLNKKRKK